MSVIIARHNGDYMLKSTDTGQLALITAEEWAAFVRRIKSGHLDYTLQPTTPWPVRRSGMGAPRLDLADVLRSRIEADDTCALTYAHYPHGHDATGKPQCPGLTHEQAAKRRAATGTVEDTAPRGTDAAEEHAPKPATVAGYTHERGTDGWVSK